MSIRVYKCGCVGISANKDEVLILSECGEGPTFKAVPKDSAPVGLTDEMSHLELAGFQLEFARIFDMAEKFKILIEALRESD